MNLQEFKKYCSLKKGVTEAFPFDDETLVIKVSSKMFALTNITDKDFKINLKCDPMLSEALRQEYKAITPGYHMNKTHWNTIAIDGSINKEKLLFLIDLSYDLVVKGLKKSERESVR